MNNGDKTAVLFVSLLAVLHIAAIALPPELTWGFHFLRFLGSAHAAAYALLVGLLIFASATGRLAPAVDRLAAATGSGFPLLLPAGLAFFAAAAFVFRVDVPLLGDSWYLVSNFASAIRGTNEVLPRNEPLATWYLTMVLGLFDVKSYPAFLDAFFAGGVLLGAGFVVVVHALTGVLFAERRARLVSFLLICSLPCVVLFFGYVETYASVLFALSLFALASALYVAGRVSFTVVAMAFLLQVLTHYLTALTLPSLAYLAWHGAKRGRGRDVAVGAAVSCGAFLLVLASVGFDVSNYFSRVPHKHYLPLTTPVDQVERYSSPYTLFAPFHFLDLGNLAILLLAPAAGLCLCALPAVTRRRGHDPGPGDGAGARPDATLRRAMERFLLAAMAPAALFAFVAKYDLGTARDWDVLGPFSFLFVLFGLLFLYGRAPAGGFVLPAATIAGATLLNSVVWWTLVGSDAPTVERFRALMDERLMGQAGMYNANLYLSRYYHQVGIGERESAELWLAYIQRYPGDIRGFRNVLTNTRHQGAAAAAEKLLGWSRAFGRNPLTDRTMVSLAVEWGNAALGEDRDADAELFYETAIDIDPADAPSWNNLGTVHARREAYVEAAAMFSRAVALDSTFADAWFNLGRAWLATGRSAEAGEAIATSARLGNRAARSLLSTGSVQP